MVRAEVDLAHRGRLKVERRKRDFAMDLQNQVAKKDGLKTRGTKARLSFSGGQHAPANMAESIEEVNVSGEKTQEMAF